MLATPVTKHLAGRHDQRKHGRKTPASLTREELPEAYLTYQKFAQASADLDADLLARGLDLPNPVLTTVAQAQGALQKYYGDKAKLTPFAEARLNLESKALMGDEVDWETEEKNLSGLLEDDLNQEIDGEPAYAENAADQARLALPEYLHILKTQAEQNKAHIASVLTVGHPGTPAAKGMSAADNEIHIANSFNISRETLKKLDAHYHNRAGQLGLDIHAVGGMSKGFVRYLAKRIPTIEQQINRLSLETSKSFENRLAAIQWPEVDLTGVKSHEDFAKVLMAWRPKFEAALWQSGEDPITFSTYMSAETNAAYQKFLEKMNKA